jgi:ligand-binding sensor domain-containing protein
MQPVYRIIDQQNGLPDNVVYDLKEGSDGLLYIAHQKGLCSFDGSRFVSFYNKSFPFQSVTNIMQTKDGTLWCRSFSGALFALKRDTLFWEPKVPQGNVYYYASAFGHCILGFADDSLFVFDSRTGTLQKKEIPEQFSAVDPASVELSTTSSFEESVDRLTSVVIDSQLNIYRLPIRQYKKWLPVFDIKTGKTTVVKHVVLKQLFSDFPTLFSIRNHPTLQGISVNNAVLEDSVLWICATDGVYKLNVYSTSLKAEHFFGGYNVSFVCKDRSGNYFFSTIGSGILLVPDFNVRRLGAAGLNSGNIAGVGELIYAGSAQGDVNRYHIPSNTTELVHKSAVTHPVEFLFYDSFAHSVLRSADKFVSIKKGRHFAFNFIVKDACYADSNIILVTNASLYCMRNSKLFESTARIFKLKPVFEDMPGLYVSRLFEGERIYQVASDHSNQCIAFYSFSGLSVLNYRTGNLYKIKAASSLINDMVWHQGLLYLATKDKGLQVQNQGVFQEVTDREGYRINAMVLKLYSYKDELWILTENGVFIFKDGELTPLDMMSDGIAGQIKELLISESNIYAGTNTGVIELAKAGVMRQKKLPILRINKITNPHYIFQSDRRIEVAYNENHFSIDFSLIAFANAGSTHLAYTINSGKPIHLARQVRNIELNNLAPDTYTITLIPVLYNKLLSDQSQSIVFTVNPPFWRTWWFIGLLVLAASLIVWQVMQTVVRNQRKDFAHKKSAILLEGELNKSILTGIKSQMNPHFIFNALNTIQSYIYMNDKRSASVYISKFSDLTRNILDMSTRDSITIAEEIHSLNLYLELEKMRFEDSFNFDLQVDEQLDKELVRIPAMLVQPYVENAVKHGLLHKKTDRKLAVLFMKEGPMLKIVIDDNGIGRKRSADLKKNRHQHHQSFAMDANKKRIEILRQSYQHIQLEIVDKLNNLQEACGTQVIISLPL